MELTSFKAYDVRGKVPAALNEDLARQIGVAYVHETGARNVVIGHDARLSGPALYAALADCPPQEPASPASACAERKKSTMRPLPMTLTAASWSRAVTTRRMKTA